MNGIKICKELGISFRIGVNHENKPSVFMNGVDCEDMSCGFTLTDLNTFIEMLEERREDLVAIASSEKDKHQNLLFKEGFDMPKVKDENNG